MTISEIEQKIINEFSIFEDWMDKYNYLIDMGRTLPIIDEKYKTDQYLISGCQSRVWLSSEMKDGNVIYKADSDAVITKGIANLLIRVLSNQTPEDIIATKLDFIDEIGLKEHLSPTRSNGLTSMIKQMKLYALVFKTKMQTQEKS
ncbi:MAG: SufE family protein [Bacteroidales bacterium]|nr:SufE family protein [Bacteroidales bacterium]